MTNQPITQSQKRFQDSIGSLFTQDCSTSDLLVLKSSSDVGVERNGGRNGAKFAPQSLLSYFKKLNKKPTHRNQKFLEIEVSNEGEEKADFHQAQIAEAARIKTALVNSPKAKIWHIGGGHDHVFPLLMALSDRKKIIVINVDAHADTRTDEQFHSGTPFRQFSNNYQGTFRIFQIGLTEFANSESTLSPLKKGSSRILWKNELNDIQKSSNFFEEIKKEITPDAVVLFSLDADALAGQEVPGVSAVNGHGLIREELVDLWQKYISLGFGHAPILGIYELNPVYDTLSMMSMRVLGTFVYENLI